MFYCLDFQAQSGEKGLEASPSSLIGLTCRHSYMVGSGFETRFGQRLYACTVALLDLACFILISMVSVFSYNTLLVRTRTVGHCHHHWQGSGSLAAGCVTVNKFTAGRV